MADSVHRLLCEQIDELGFAPWFEPQKTVIKCTRTGSEFIFKGLHHNLQEIKSTEGVTKAWIEEAQSVSALSLQTLIPTIREEGSEIWASYNPMNEDDPIHVLANNPPPGSIVADVNWSDNPWFPAVLDDERKHCLRVNPDDYGWIWEGACRKISAASVFRGKLVVDRFETPDHGVVFYHGADWGFAADPTALVRCWISGDRLMVDHEAWGVGVDLDDTPALFDRVPTARTWPILADCARPETISHMRRRGFNIAPADKWHGSVEDGIAHLRGYEKIVVHERCTHAAEELRKYSYKTDRRTGMVLPDLVEGNDHISDAMRYALSGLITRGGTGIWARLNG